MKETSKKLGCLIEHNIPNLSKETSFSRKELYSFFVLFKSLYDITSMKQKLEKKEKPEGVVYEIWKQGVFRLSTLPEELVKKIYIRLNEGAEGYLNWRDFLNCMKMVNARTLTDKIDLFIKIADDDGNGELSYEEVYDLCLLCLNKYMHISDCTFVEELAKFFARFIFEVCEIELDDEIPITKIKTLISEGHPDSNLLCMFCGADV